MLTKLETALVSILENSSKSVRLEFQLLRDSNEKLNCKLQESERAEFQARQALQQHIDGLTNRILHLESSLAQFSRQFGR